MRPAIREVELVDELLTKGQRVQLGGGTINESLIEVIEFGLPNPPAVGDHEPIQLRAISTSERAINRISKRTGAVRTGPGEHSPGPRPELLAAAADQLEPNRQSRPRLDQQCCQQLRRNQLPHIHFGTTGSGSLVTGLLCTQAPPLGADLRSRSIKWLT